MWATRLAGCVGAPLTNEKGVAMVGARVLTTPMQHEWGVQDSAMTGVVQQLSAGGFIKVRWDAPAGTEEKAAGALSQLLSGWIRPAKCVLLEPELLENA